MLGLYSRWESARKPHEQALLDCYADYMRIARDDDTRGSGAAKSRKARGVFVGSTRNKIRSAVAKIFDALFGNGEKLPFDTTPEKEEFAHFAEAMEKVLRWLLIRGGFTKALRKTIQSMAIYGTGFLCGPFVRMRRANNTTLGEGGTLQNVPLEYAEPYYEHVRTLDVYPDPEAKCLQRGDGVFLVSWISPNSAEFEGWEGDPAYRNIDEVKRLNTLRRSEGSRLADDLRAIVQRHFNNEGNARVCKYFGVLPRTLLDEWEKDGPPAEPDGDTAGHEKGETPKTEATEDGAAADEGAEGKTHEDQETPEIEATEDEMVEAFVVIVGGVVVRANKSEFYRRPVFRGLYEEGDDEFWGVGIAENNKPHQKLINAAFRLFVEGKGLALNPPISINRRYFENQEDFKVGPGKVWNFKQNATPEEMKSALQVHLMPDVSDGWEKIIDISERFSDDDTSISKYSQGNDARHLNDTATGISMIMNAGSLPLKQVLMNIDGTLIEPCIEDTLKWALDYLDPRIVGMVLGAKTGEIWAAIQKGYRDFGGIDYVQWRATGAKTLMAKEVLLNKLQGFLGVVAANPQLAQMVDMRELVEQIWNAADVGLTSPVYTQEDLAEMAQMAQQGAGVPGGMGGMPGQPGMTPNPAEGPGMVAPMNQGGGVAQPGGPGGPIGN